jgi:hypothetical protein
VTSGSCGAQPAISADASTTDTEHETMRAVPRLPIRVPRCWLMAFDQQQDVAWMSRPGPRGCGLCILCGASRGHTAGRCRYPQGSGGVIEEKAVSEIQQDPDWWMASDGKWYPPSPIPEMPEPAAPLDRGRSPESQRCQRCQPRRV